MDGMRAHRWMGELVTSYWFSVSAVPGSMIAFAIRETIIQVGISFVELSSNVLGSGALVSGARGLHICLTGTGRSSHAWLALTGAGTARGQVTTSAAMPAWSVAYPALLWHIVICLFFSAAYVFLLLTSAAHPWARSLQWFLHLWLKSYQNGQ